MGWVPISEARHGASFLCSKQALHLCPAQPTALLRTRNRIVQVSPHSPPKYLERPLNPQTRARARQSFWFLCKVSFKSKPVLISFTIKQYMSLSLVTMEFRKGRGRSAGLLTSNALSNVPQYPSVA